MIFCVEDDSNIRELEVYSLQSLGFKACGLSTAQELFALLEEKMPELIILDIMLPDLDGLAILRKIRSNPVTKDIPVIMATAKGSEFDKVMGLDSGADDYLAKPFGVMEMVSRVKAVLRRSAKENKDSKVYTFAEIVLDNENYIVKVNDKSVELTLKEFELLKKLMQNAGQVYTRDQLLNTVWGYEYTGETRTVDVHIRHLRQKLGETGDYIATVRGIGYRLMNNSSDEVHKDEK